MRTCALSRGLANGEIEKAAIAKAFYDEYFAVLDLTAEFYLETVRHIFQEYTANWPYSLPYADVCENNELRTYCISIKPLSTSGGMAERFYNF